MAAVLVAECAKAGEQVMAAKDSSVTRKNGRIVESSTPEERRRLARSLLLPPTWTPRIRVVETLRDRYGVSQSAAYRIVQEVWEEVAEAQASTKKAELARVHALIDTQIADVMTAVDVSPLEKATTINLLVSQLAKLGGLYPDSQKIMTLRLEIQRITQLSDDDLDRALADEKRQLASAIDVEGEET